ncbi:MAG: tetratricopeptide repeat protein [Candidatus Didemnitutus sp.]|nr:tetratricopeptide repeat protein [Candidatus Didemnitutus sp.]
MFPIFTRVRQFGLVALAILTATIASAQSRDYSLTDSTSEFLSTAYKTAIEAKNFDTALAGINAQIAKLSDPSGYDAAVLNQFKAQVLLQKGSFTESIVPLETALRLSDAKSPSFFEERAILETVYFLSQLYFQEATSSKNPAHVKRSYELSESYIKRWISMNKKPNPEVMLFYASLLYNRATQDGDDPDLASIGKALEVVDEGLRMSTRPKDHLYILKLVCLQHLGRNAEAIELLELLVVQQPSSRNYWQQLVALYLGQGQDIRAILAFERGQANGFMTGPKDNYNLVGIHFNIGQYERAAELLEKGLADGSIESEEKNWELLAYSYQQLNRDFKAIDTLKRATKVFPASGQLEYLIAQNYYTMEKMAEALPHLEAAVRKGGGNRPHQTYLFLAFVAYDLKKFDLALKAAEDAIATEDGKAEGERMKQSILDVIRERDAKLQKS